VEIGSEWNTLGKKDVLPHWLLWLTDAWLQCLLGSPAWTVLARSWLSETYVLVKHYKEKKSQLQSTSASTKKTDMYFRTQFDWKNWATKS
jgi:hypothetical protein